MPFLRRLLAKEHYRLHSLYSGLPASTPAVQGELFYGCKCAVPAFGFRRHETKKIVRMFACDVASGVQSRLEARGAGLLAGGSSYCNIYDGGARESHFCSSSLGWDEMIKAAHPGRLTLVLIFHAWSAMRTLGLLAVEFVLAAASFLRGFNSREFWPELVMIPARIVVVLLMRELAINGAVIDARIADYPSQSLELRRAMC